ncbi:hypothetical protein MB828_02575 [Streptomyces arenae]|nr:hypothetical protein [Streptomyces arenae]
MTTPAAEITDAAAYAQAVQDAVGAAAAYLVVAGENAGSKRAKAEALGTRLATPDEDWSQPRTDRAQVSAGSDVGPNPHWPDGTLSG